MNIGLLRAVFLFLPLGLATIAWLVVRPDARRRAGVVVALSWNLVALGAWSPVALDLGWWSWNAEGGVLLGMPADVWIGWAVAWGVLPALLVTEVSATQLVGAVAVAFWLDLVLLPFGSPLLVLGPAWLRADVYHIGTALVPGILLAEATRQRRWRAASAVGQTVGWWLLALGVVPAIALEATGGQWPSSWSAPWRQVGLQLVGLAVLAFCAAVRAFVEDGDGTPIPLDPPRRLVTTGPYAYVANPMQLTAALVFVGWGILLGSPWIVAGAAVVVGYSEGFARWHERETLEALPGWPEWRRTVRAWWPRWRPVEIGAPATLWYAESCDVCSTLARTVERLGPIGLVLRPAEQHPTLRLDRLTWERDGCAVDQGWPALCRALEHVNLGWALVGWCGRLPILRELGQMTTDALGGAPRTVGAGRMAEDPRDPAGRMAEDPRDPAGRMAEDARDPAGRMAEDPRDPRP